MNPSLRLYGHPILTQGKVTLTDQIYDILCEEIHGGRWRIGDRLPSITDLARESGLSRRPIQLALDRMREAGIVRQEKSRGTFLAALLPEGRKPLGVIGVARPMHYLDGELVSSVYGQWSLHEILQCASRRRYLTEVASLETNDPQWENLTSPEGPFKRRLDGIISLRQLRNWIPDRAPDDIPLVFLGVQATHCIPGVTPDLDSGAYLLTRRLIELGHRRILFCEEPDFGKLINSLQYQACKRATSESRIKLHKVTFSPRNCSLSVLPEIRKVLQDAERPTAFFCLSMQKAREIIGMADLLDIPVPDQLSVVASIGRPMDLVPVEPQIAGMRYDFLSGIEMCVDLLLDQIQTRANPWAHLRLRPFLVEGATLSPAPEPNHLTAQTRI